MVMILQGRKRKITYCYIKVISDRISSHANQTLAERKFNTPNFLPLTEDIVCLKNYLLDQEQTLGKELEINLSLSMWRNLAQVILCRVTIFNKRRGGEVGQRSLTMYENRIY